MKIKEKVNIGKPFSFSISTEADICGIISPHLTKIYNDSKSNCTFPNALKYAEITPAHKKDDNTKKDNYRPISILPSISKVFERSICDQTSLYTDRFVSPYLCGFRKGYSTQYCLTFVLERWKKHWIKGK